MTGFMKMLITALYAMVLQNLVFSAAYGLTETIKVAKKPKHLLMYSLSVGLFSVTTSVLCFFLDRIEVIAALPAAIHFLIYTVVLAAIYLICAAVFAFGLKADKKFMNSLGMCAFNTLVLSVPIINSYANHSLWEALGMGFGAALAFLLAALLIGAGMRHIVSSKNIPAVFRGTPALLIYISLLSLAFSCFTGESLFL